MAAITIERDGIKIPLEAIEDNGITVITLAPRAWLILNADAVAAYPRNKLDALQRAARNLVGEPEPESEYPSYYSPGKVRALKEMRAMGIDVSGGEEYFDEMPENPPSLEQVREILSKTKRSLSDEVIAERDER
ncbi:MAG: hypothetical protein EYC68_21740 [Chloroflexota bacterium]|nr:MAG: hypothetical protein EYC68_21740 [Chloroflexota bacterium]